MAYKKFYGYTDRVCDECKDKIEGWGGFYIYRFSTHVGVEICSTSCAKKYSKKMKNRGHYGRMLTKRNFKKH